MKWLNNNLMMSVKPVTCPLERQYMKEYQVPKAQCYIFQMNSEEWITLSFPRLHKTAKVVFFLNYLNQVIGLSIKMFRA